MKKLTCLVVIYALAVFLVPFVALAASTSEMVNVLTQTGEDYLNGTGMPNPAYGKRIKNIMIYQAGGWLGLLIENRTTWPQTGALPGYTHGPQGYYLIKSSEIFLHQMAQIKGLSDHLAIAVLIMPNDECVDSGYGALWNFDGAMSDFIITDDGKWDDPETDGMKAHPNWRTPKALFQEIKFAAWMKGIQVAPLISINNFDLPPGPHPEAVLGKLQEFVNWYMGTVDLTSLHTTDGKVVILTEGLLENTHLKNKDATGVTYSKQVLDYMNSRQDILWIDNLACLDEGEIPDYPNVYRSAATGRPHQDGNPGDFTHANDPQGYRKALWGARYLWHFVDRVGKKPEDMYDPKNKIPADIQEKWLNIGNPDPVYPVIISQWNEYSEFSVFEPNLFDGYQEYDYLKWRLSQQP